MCHFNNKNKSILSTHIKKCLNTNQLLMTTFHKVWLSTELIITLIYYYFADNLDTIVRTMFAFFLLTPKLCSPINRTIHYRSESIFVQYNIARIKSIIRNYNSNYSIIGPLNQPDDIFFSLLNNDHEWNLIFIHLLKMQQINQTLINQLIEPALSGECDFECNKMINQLQKACHSFSCYYRNVKILLNHKEHLSGHLNQLIKTRVKFCDILLQQFCFYFQLLDIPTAEQI